MQKDTLDRRRAELAGMLERLEAEVREIELHDRDSLSEASGENAYRDHMADQGSATFERELDMTLEENLRRSLDDVRSAIRRMDEGTYGMCERCDASIPDERLEAVPTANLCIRCKADEESR